jgi:hypothetical protein
MFSKNINVIRGRKAVEMLLIEDANESAENYA